MYVVVQLFVQILINGLGAVLGLAAIDKKQILVKDAIDTVLKRFWRFILLQIRIFLFTLPYTLLLLFVVASSFVFAVNNPGTLSLILPVTGVVGIILVVAVVRVFVRYSLSAFYFFDNETSGVSESMKASKE